MDRRGQTAYVGSKELALVGLNPMMGEFDHGDIQYNWRFTKSMKPFDRNLDRRRFLRTAIIALAATEFSMTACENVSAQGRISMDTQTHATTSTAVRPFHINMPQKDLDELRQRLVMTRLPARELVADRSQGVQLATVQALARYWTSDYDFRRFETRLNALPQFVTEIDGLDIHFIHVKSRHDNALPLIMTHGWPGSVIELLEVIGPLTDPTAHGGRAEDAFDLVLPSLPGFGFSAKPTSVGWNTGRIAGAWAELMHRLGYTRYVAQGGDVGATVTDAMGRQAPTGLLGIHMNLLLAGLISGGYPSAKPSAEERAASAAIAMFNTSGKGYLIEQATRPQTIGYALLDSPVALAAWMLDHDTDSYEKISRAFLGGQPAGHLTRDRIVDNITLYWLTGTGASAAREYWEGARAQALAVGHTPPPVSLPVGFTTFPGEIFRAPRSWVEKSYRNLIYFHEVDRGGHFAAWEEPELFATEIRAAFRSLR
jgi:pimeloyl-ACP methyl ester carboxylesterase